MDEVIKHNRIQVFMDCNGADHYKPEQLANYMFVSLDALFDLVTNNPEMVKNSIEEMLAENSNEAFVDVWDARSKEYISCKKRPIAGVTIHFDVMDMVNELDDTELGELVRCLMQYGLAENNNEPYELKTDTRAVRMLFPAMKSKHDAERKAVLLSRQKQANRRKKEKGDDND